MDDMNSGSEDEVYVGVPDQPRVLPEEVLLDEETRNIQAMLVSKLLGKGLDIETIEKHRQQVDLPIICWFCAEHSLSMRYNWLMKPYHTEDVVKAIQEATCQCDQAKTILTKLDLLEISCLDEAFLPILKFLVETGGDIDGRYDNKTHAPIFATLRSKNLLGARFLVESGVDVNVPSLESNLRPLWYAITHHLEEFVDLLLSVPSIDKNIKHERGYPLLQSCLRSGSEFFVTLLRAGADPNAVDLNQTSALMIAITRGNMDAVKTLIRYGADVNQRNRRNETPLIIAIFGGNAAIVEVLLDSGADPNFMPTNEADTPFLLSCFDGDLVIVRLLIKFQANVRQSNHLGYTPLHIAAWNGHINCVRLLLDAGALHDIQTKDLNTPLALAAHGRHLKVVQELLPLGCNVNSADKDNDTALHYAAYNGMTKTVELLLQNGANPNCRNRVNATPLWNAVYCGALETVKLLVKQNVKMEVYSVGIDQHHQSDDVRYIYEVQRSPLWVAVDRCHCDIVMVLLQAGYNIHRENWLLDMNEIPDYFDDEHVKSTLQHCVTNPNSLLRICQSFIRRRLGLGIEEKVKELEIPKSLERYLTFTDLTYNADPQDEDSEEMESDDD